jgi:hypothetical protein
MVDRMFEPFSRGYYLGRLYIQPSADKRVTLCRAQYERVHRALYNNHDDADQPLVMKLDTTHLPVRPAGGIPADTLAVPERVLEATSIRNPPTLEEVFLATADRADQLLSLGSPSTPQGA